VHIATETMSLVVLPLALVYIAISMNQSALSISFVVLPETFVERAVSPDLRALAIALLSNIIPFSLVLCAILKCSLRLLGTLHAIILCGFRVHERSEIGADFLNSLIIIVYHSGVQAHPSHSFCDKSVSLLHTTTGKHTPEKSLNLYDQSDLVTTSES
jgi:hypothetical protein